MGDCFCTGIVLVPPRLVGPSVPASALSPIQLGINRKHVVVAGAAGSWQCCVADGLLICRLIILVHTD